MPQAQLLILSLFHRLSFRRLPEPPVTEICSIMPTRSTSFIQNSQSIKKSKSLKVNHTTVNMVSRQGPLTKCHLAAFWEQLSMQITLPADGVACSFFSPQEKLPPGPPSHVLFTHITHDMNCLCVVA